MSLTTRTLTNAGHPLYAPNGAVLVGETIKFTLVNVNGQPVAAFDGTTGARVLGIVETTTDSNGEFSVNLWPNDRGDVFTKYICTINYSDVNQFSAQVPSGNAALSWLDFKLSGATLTATEVTALNAHIGDTLAHGATGGVVGATTVQTLTNKKINKRALVLSANSATPAINTDLYDSIRIISQSAAITSFTSNMTGTPLDGDELRISIIGTTSISLTFGSLFESSSITLPTTTTSTDRLDMLFFWNVSSGKWRVVLKA